MNKLAHISACLVVIAAGIFTVACQNNPLADIRKSHIDQNVPEDKEFMEILTRDLTKYVTDKGETGISVNVELLRPVPTQVGVALPKFYCWLQKLDANKKVMEEAALRMAAVDKTHFEVIQYFEKEKVLKDMELMKKVFPDDVYEKIMQKAKAQ